MSQATQNPNPFLDLTPETQAALKRYLPSKMPEPGTEARSALLARVADDVEAAWRAAEAADAEGAFVDLPMARRIQAALTRALTAAESLPSDLVTLLVGAARYFAKVDDADGDHLNQWGYDDDRTVVDGVITVINQHAETSLKRTGNVIRPPPRPSRAGLPPGRKLPRVDARVRDVLFFHPAAIAEPIFEIADLVVDHARRDGVTATIADLRQRVADHVEAAQQARDAHGIVDIDEARAIAQSIQDLIGTHEEASPFNDRVLPLVLAAAEMFVTTDDGADDLEAPFGFDDERVVVQTVQSVIRSLRAAP